MIYELIYKMITYYNELHNENDRVANEITATALKQTNVKFYGNVEQLEYFFKTFIEEADTVLKNMYTKEEEK